MGDVIKKIKQKKELILIIFILLLAFFIRFSNYDSEFQGYDPFVHYSVVEQALENNQMPIRNQLDGCPDGIMLNHPVGFYLPPYILGKLINLKLAFALSSVLFGVLTIFLIYLVFKKVFNTRTAIIGSLFLSVCFAHISRSQAAYYRGENFMLPLMLLSLFFALKFLTEEKKLLYAILAAVFSASTALFWPGYPYALLVYILSVALFIIYDFIKNKEINKNINFAVISFIVQFAIVKLIGKISSAPEHTFTAKYYLLFVLIPSIIFLIVLKISNKYLKKGIKQRIVFIGIIFVLILAAVSTRKDILQQLSTGFGLLKPTTTMYKNIAELQPITLKSLFYALWFIPILSAAGLAIMLIKLNNKKLFLLGLVIPGIYLLTTTMRFIFLGSVMIIPLVGILFNSLRKVNKKVLYGTIIILLVLTGAHSISQLKRIGVSVSPDMIQGFDYFRQNTNKTSCLITIPDWGGMTQYYAKRASHTSSTNQNPYRFEKLNDFLFTNKSFDIDIENSFIGLMPDDFKKTPSLISIVGVKDLSMRALILIDKKREEDIGENIYKSLDGITYVAEISNGGVSVRRIEDGDEVAIRTVFIESNNAVYEVVEKEAEDDGCVYLSNYVTAYFNNKLCNTNIVKMLTQQQIEGLEHWYSHNNVRIYKVN